METKGKNGVEIKGRKKFKKLKKFCKGNGLSSVEAQKRYREIRNGITRYARDKDLMESLEEGYRTHLLKYETWRKDVGLDTSNDDDSESSKQPEAPVLPDISALDDDLDDHMLAHCGDDVTAWMSSV